MLLSRTRWLLPALSLCTASLMIASPVALADEHGSHDDQHHALTVQRPNGDDRNDNDQDADNNHDRDDRATAEQSRVTRLVAALNNQVAMLSAVKFDTDDADDARADNDADDTDAALSVTTISLATIEAHLSPANATTVANAVSANTAGLQAFLSGGSANAADIDAALAAAGIGQSSALAIFARHDHLLVVTS